MKVLLLAPHPFFQQRGTPIAEKMLLHVLAAHGHEIDVLTFAEGDDPGIPGIPGCRIHRIPHLPGVRGIRPGFSLKKLASDAVMLWKCLRLVRRGRYDLVHAVEESAFMALAAHLLFGTPYVYDMDSGLARQMIDKLPFLRPVRRLLEACEALAVRGSAGTLAVCKSLEDQARACHPGGLVARIEDVSLLPHPPGPPLPSPPLPPGEGGRASRVFPQETGGGAPLPGAGGAMGEGTGVRSLGDDFRDTRSDTADDLPLEDFAGHPVVMYVGNLEPYQGIDLLVEAFACALPEVPAARLVVIGGDPTAIEAYRARCAALGIAGAVLFAGPRPVERLGAYLQRATVLVSPRIHGDNTPMKVYSYLDSGRALLATRLPTHTQVLTGDIACLVDPEPAAMARGLVRLLRDEVLRERLAANAKEMARRELTPPAFERKLLAFYDQVAQAIGGEWPDGKTQRLEARRPVAR